MAVVVTPSRGNDLSITSPPVARRNPWLLRIGVALLGATYIFASGLTAFTGIAVTDLDVFFVPSAAYVLQGHPLHIYALRYGTDYPTANGPVSIMLLAGTSALAQHLGWFNDFTLRRMLIMAFFSVFPLLMSWEAVAAIDRVRGTPLRGFVRLLAYGFFATAPGIWHSVLLYGHVETPIAVWLTLLTVRLLAEQRSAWAGLSMGLALLTRTSVIVPCVVLFVVLLERRRLAAAAKFLGLTALTVGLGILPFYLADARDVVYSLVTFRGVLGIGGGSLWYLFIGTPLEKVGNHYDSATIVGAAALITVLILLLHRRLTVAHRDLYGLLVITGLCFPLLIKTTWPYYFFDLYIYVGIWWMGDARGWNTVARWLGLLLPAVVLLCEGIADYGTTVQGYDTPMRIESLAMTVLQGGYIVVFGIYLIVRAAWARRRTKSDGMASVPPTVDGEQVVPLAV
jgi:hypothetical protein